MTIPPTPLELLMRLKDNISRWVGNIVFDPTITGYNLFRTNIHKNIYTGIIHGFCMPITCWSFFLIIYSLLCIYGTTPTNSMIHTKQLLIFIIGAMFAGYVTYDPFFGVLSLVSYWIFINYFMIRTIKYNKYVSLCIGIVFFISSVCFLEFFSHVYLEGLSSNLWEFSNSVYHTPLYATKSLFLLT